MVTDLHASPFEPTGRGYSESARNARSCQETPGSCQVISSLGGILRLGWNGALPQGGALWVGFLVAFCWVCMGFLHCFCNPVFCPVDSGSQDFGT
jgi:hypothetical protein